MWLVSAKDLHFLRSAKLTYLGPLAAKQHLAVRYDVLSPIMQRQEEGKVQEEPRPSESSKQLPEPASGLRSSEIMVELSTYARMLENGPPVKDAPAQPLPLTGSSQIPAANGEISTNTSASSSRPPSRLELVATSCKDMVEMLSRSVHKSELSLHE
jgi:hypothetical protein